MSTSLPYPGLRPFHRDETDIFFGREEQVDQLLEKLSQLHFLSVVGPSGCGKSSLVRAGMIASLEAGFMVSAGAYWRVAEMRPGSHPMKRLSVALLDVLKNERAEEDALAFLHANLRRGPLGLVEILRETPLPGQTNLLLMVDQFEEIFRFRKEGDIDEADAFVSLLIKSASQRELPIYVVITMRSDFLGDCAVFTELPELINESQFLTPRLTREQCRSAIVGPAKVFGGDVAPELVNNLLNDMGTDPDQLPLMQHLMMRMWTQKQLALKGDEEASRINLTYSDYETAGGLEKALSNHADEAFKQLNKEQQKIAEVLFRCLSERSSEKRDTRRPIPLEVIAKAAGVSTKKVEKIIEVFRHPNCSFLTPPQTERLYPNTIIDISHESLIRQWERMNIWVEQETKSAEKYRLLEQTASLWKEGKAALWGTPDLEYALEWKKREKPTAQWAERYGKYFKLAIKFLDTSDKEHKKKKEKEEKKRQQELQLAKALAEAQKKSAAAERQRAEAQTKMNRWLRRLAISLVITLMLSGAIVYWYLDGYVLEHTAYYNTFAKRWGIPVGVGQLTEDQVRHRAVSFKLIKKGRSNPVIRMETINSKGELTLLHAVGTYYNPTPATISQSKECQWEFVLDKNGRIVYEKAYDKDDKLVWGFVYSPSQEVSKNIRDAHFVGPDGYPRPQKKSAANFVSFEYSDVGYELYLYYRDRSGNPIPGPDKAFGRMQIFDNRGLILEMTSLGPDSLPMNDEAGNASLKMTFDELGNITKAVGYNSEGNITTLKDGWASVLILYYDNENETNRAFFAVDG